MIQYKIRLALSLKRYCKEVVLIMIDIDLIMKLIDWNEVPENQLRGIELAKEVKAINVFFQPHDSYNNKNVWSNCAKILSERDEIELRPYYAELLEWLQDLNWPGAAIVFTKLKKSISDSYFQMIYSDCKKKAKLLDDEIWLSNLQKLENSDDGDNKPIEWKVFK